MTNNGRLIFKFLLFSTINKYNFQLLLFIIVFFFLYLTIQRRSLLGLIVTCNKKIKFKILLLTMSLQNTIDKTH